jgi:hypothetical protein
MDLINFIKICADKKVLQMFHAGARGGFEITCAVADDVHNACSKLADEEDGMGLTALKAVFPHTESSIRKHLKRVERLETELYPILPQEGVVYHAEVLSFKKEEEVLIECQIVSLRPEVKFSLTSPLDIFDEEDEWLYVKLDKDGWRLV